MSRLIASSRFRLPGLLRRRPTLEVHVPMSPTPSFLYQLRCLTHSLRRFGGAYRDSPVIATVNGDPADERLADRMPWLAANGIELRWVPADKFAALRHPRRGRSPAQAFLQIRCRSPARCRHADSTSARRPDRASPSRGSPGRDHRARLAFAVWEA